MFVSMEQNKPQENEGIEDTKVQINLSKQQHDRMKLQALLLGISLEELIFSHLQEYIDNEESSEKN
jgi:predicted HicB family RNase H-like nuclease